MSYAYPAVWTLDDDADDQLLLQTAFNERHPAIAVTSLPTFGALLTTIQQANPLPSLLLVDLQMPGVTGLEVLLYLRRQAAYSQLPIIILSDSEEGAARQQALALGAAEFLLKPFSYSELLELVTQLVVRWSLVSAELAL